MSDHEDEPRRRDRQLDQLLQDSPALVAPAFGWFWFAAPLLRRRRDRREREYGR